MPAGRLNKRVRFERERKAADGAGGYALSWVPELTCWGGLAVERGRERVDGGRVAESLAGVLTVRSSAEARTISAAYRVLVDGEYWNIRSISNPDQRKKYLELVVERGVAT